MMELILLAIGIAGFGVAGYLDLKTTEFPDWLPYSMIAAALGIRGVFALLSADWSILVDSIAIGGGFLAFGLALYFFKQWGDGDAWLLGALGFLFPTASGFAYKSMLPFPLALIFNFFLAAFAYVIVYSVALSLTRPDVYRGFADSLRRDCKGTAVLVSSVITAYFVLLVVMFFQFGFVPPSPLYVAAFPVFILFVALFSRYGVYMEKNLFKRRIPASRLRPGDVPVGRVWRVLKPPEVRELRRRGGYVWIKEGVRFAPVFLITLLLTLLFGDLFSALFRLV